LQNNRHFLIWSCCCSYYHLYFNYFKWLNHSYIILLIKISIWW
jgi:hypothetical protein